jgi:carbon storage regulator
MLILERHSGESIHINDDIKLTIYYNKGSQIKMGIEAPRHISIMREELLESKKGKTKEEKKPLAKAIQKSSQPPSLELVPIEKVISPVIIKTKRKKRIISHSL